MSTTALQPESRWQRFGHLFVGDYRASTEMPRTVRAVVMCCGIVAGISGLCALYCLVPLALAPRRLDPNGGAASGFDTSAAIFTASWWLTVAHRKGKPIARWVQLLLYLTASLGAMLGALLLELPTKIAFFCPILATLFLSFTLQVIIDKNVCRWYTPDAD